MRAPRDFIIVMARVGNDARQGGITSFIVEKGTPGFIIEREIPMLGGDATYEIVFEDCRIPKDSVLGEVGKGYAPMQLRLRTRRLEMGSTCIGIAKRALDMLCEHARQRETFGVKLADRQAIQWWVADISTRIHACRLMVRDAADKTDRGEDVRQEASMIKVFATEMAYEACDHAMQTLGALGMTLEIPLNALSQKARLMRMYEGPSEVHRQSIARRVLGLRGNLFRRVFYADKRRVCCGHANRCPLRSKALRRRSSRRCAPPASPSRTAWSAPACRARAGRCR